MNEQKNQKIIEELAVKLAKKITKWKSFCWRGKSFLGFVTVYSRFVGCVEGFQVSFEVAIKYRDYNGRRKAVWEETKYILTIKKVKFRFFAVEIFTTSVIKSHTERRLSRDFEELEIHIVRVEIARKAKEDIKKRIRSL